MGSIRQSLRKAFILISFLLFPVTIFYLSPAVPIGGIIERVLSGSLIVFSALFIISLFAGRLFCSWICPGGGLGEACMIANQKRLKSTRLSWLKFVWWIPWVVLLLVLYMKSGGFQRVDFFYQTKNGISISEPWMYIVYYGVVGLIAILSLLSGRRAFCHYVCWMSPFMIIGRKLGSLLRIPSVRLQCDSDKCISCKQCDKKCAMSLNVSDMVHNGKLQHSECILCGECVDVCPKKAIRFTLGR